MVQLKHMLTASIVPSTSPIADTFAQCMNGFAEESGHTPGLMMSATGQLSQSGVLIGASSELMQRQRQPTSDPSSGADESRTTDIKKLDLGLLPVSQTPRLGVMIANSGAH
jgi:hypothetical protein